MHCVLAGFDPKRRVVVQKKRHPELIYWQRLVIRFHDLWNHHHHLHQSKILQYNYPITLCLVYQLGNHSSSGDKVLEFMSSPSVYSWCRSETTNDLRYLIFKVGTRNTFPITTFYSNFWHDTIPTSLTSCFFLLHLHDYLLYMSGVRPPHLICGYLRHPHTHPGPQTDSQTDIKTRQTGQADSESQLAKSFLYLIDHFATIKRHHSAINVY